ncbi:MAG: hypothetical protein B6245_14535 [Desulfobacteraceae bacterium 4572_88]|nr:MAG: hypothetical protein B6245_14535 [Desulfobacteraceae bacterium 4572_88]
MKISNHAFSEKEIEDLEIYGDNQKNGRLRMRSVVLLMTAQGILPELILNVARKSGKYAQNLYYQHLAAVIIRKSLGTEGLSRSLFVKACEAGSYVIRSLSGFLRRHPVM